MTKILSVLLLLLVSCNEANFIATASYTDLNEVRMGKTAYAIKIPSTMFIEEASGKEGQLGYGLWQMDSTIRFTGISGFIEVEHGSPIGVGIDFKKIIAKARSTVLSKVVTWKINRTASGYYQAHANRGKLSLKASAATREGLDSMIAILSTLSTH